MGQGKGSIRVTGGGAEKGQKRASAILRILSVCSQDKINFLPQVTETNKTKTSFSLSPFLSLSQTHITIQ